MAYTTIAPLPIDGHDRKPNELLDLARIAVMRHVCDVEMPCSAPWIGDPVRVEQHIKCYTHCKRSILRILKVCSRLPLSRFVFSWWRRAFGIRCTKEAILSYIFHTPSRRRRKRTAKALRKFPCSFYDCILQAKSCCSSDRDIDLLLA